MSYRGGKIDHRQLLLRPLPISTRICALAERLGLMAAQGRAGPSMC